MILSVGDISDNLNQMNTSKKEEKMKKKMCLMAYTRVQPTKNQCTGAQNCLCKGAGDTPKTSKLKQKVLHKDATPNPQKNLFSFYFLTFVILINLDFFLGLLGFRVLL